MPYRLLIKKQAKKILQSLPRPEKNRIAEKIMLLGDDPDAASLDVKK
jgi:mRNA interferase RelE/StbE